ncbi:MAG: MerR family transcriptional regulator [Acidobacteriota bacterium]
MSAMTIGQIAKEAGVGIETIRFYERQGLIPEPPRSASGYRLYPAKEVRRIYFIKRAQELGFSLKEIKELLCLRVNPNGTSKAVRELTEAKIVDIEQKIKDLHSVKRILLQLTSACCGNGSVSECPIIESLEGSGKSSIQLTRKEKGSKHNHE